MTFFESCGWVAVLVACAIVVLAVLLAALLGFCLVLGAYEQTTNPHSTIQISQEYQNISQQINAGVRDINNVVPQGDK
jgi:predicted PurR-regulated permease PerM